jgi:hypothetical protein
MFTKKNTKLGIGKRGSFVLGATVGAVAMLGVPIVFENSLSS